MTLIPAVSPRLPQDRQRCRTGGAKETCRVRGAPEGARRGEDSHSRGCSKNCCKALLMTQLVYWLLGKALHRGMENILVSSARVTWGTSPLYWCIQGTRRVETGKRNLHPKRSELVIITAPPAIKCHKTPGPELTGREMLCRGNPKEKGKQISPQFPHCQSWRHCCYETLSIPMCHVPLHCC